MPQDKTVMKLLPALSNRTIQNEMPARDMILVINRLNRPKTSFVKHHHRLPRLFLVHLCLGWTDFSVCSPQPLGLW